MQGMTILPIRAVNSWQSAQGYYQCLASVDSVSVAFSVLKEYYKGDKSLMSNRRSTSSINQKLAMIHIVSSCKKRQTVIAAYNPNPL
jgi:hypothetical protein